MFSFCFAIYKNFTAIDVHTVHETKVVEEKIVDTHKIENFVEDFAKAYYSCGQTADAIDNRNEAIKHYLTAELQALNADSIRKDIPVSFSVREVQIWSVAQDGENQFEVTYTVDQLITEGENKKTVRSAYEVMVYVYGSGNMLITKNPTICSVPEKSGYEPKAKESDGRSCNQVTVSLAVKYLDQQTKTMQISQFVLMLEKNGNWKIVK